MTRKTYLRLLLLLMLVMIALLPSIGAGRNPKAFDACADCFNNCNAAYRQCVAAHGSHCNSFKQDCYSSCLSTPPDGCELP
jgi:hypothetical protein